MRTTVTLDADAEKLIRDGMRRTGESFKQVLNRAIREGLAGQSSAHPGERFRLVARPMGLRAGVDAAGLNRLADELEIEELARSQANGRRRK